MTLIIAMIMLIMITLATVASFQMSRTNLDIVGNMQSQRHLLESANAVTQEVLSTTRMFTSPGAIILNPCNGANTRCFDVNNDGTDDITVSLTPTPTCIIATPILNANLDLTNISSAACATGVQQLFGIQGAATGNSLCANSTWNVTAVASDNVTQGTITIVQGAAVRVNVANIATSCPTAGI